MALAGQWAPAPHGRGPDRRAAPSACPAANFAKPAGGRRPATPRPLGEPARPRGGVEKGGARAQDACPLGRVLDEAGGKRQD